MTNYNLEISQKDFCLLFTYIYVYTLSKESFGVLVTVIYNGTLRNFGSLTR